MFSGALFGIVETENLSTTPHVGVAYTHKLCEIHISKRCVSTEMFVDRAWRNMRNSGTNNC